MSPIDLNYKKKNKNMKKVSLGSRETIPVENQALETVQKILC